MRRTVTLVAVALVAAAIPGATATAEPSAVRWGACPEGASAPGLECSTVEVPLDYRQEKGREIAIAVSRLASKNPAKRRGVLLTNPGGPGIAGLTYPATLADPKWVQRLPQEVLDAYDIIGFDPRGIGHSSPVTCDLTAEQQAQATLTYANTSADVAKHAEKMKAVAEQCGRSSSAWMLPHITTANTARDMDRIREALGEKKISFVGASYGTYLGAVYATLFPQRGDRVVLDSNLGPGGYDLTAMRAFGRGLEDRFPDFAKFAAAKPELGLGRTPQEVRAKFFDLAAKLDKKPALGMDGTLFRAATFGFLYRDEDVPALADLWKELDKDQSAARSAAAAAPADNGKVGRLHVICGDSSWPKSVQSYQRDVAVDRIRHPLIGAAAANIGPCAYWPSEPVEPQVRITDRGPSNVLLVQNERDPGTPLIGAQKLRRAFGDRARLVTIDQGGHGVYVFAKNKCGNDAVNEFLLGGQLPARDATCAAEPA
ncbi:alpha/beta hydrolase [Allokutzneria multivorans]|uniref:Alpha/beta hydrolase n=1 Tax=Allokutzneria multivorans TaxID=1142134 RepID=A0ABP7SHL5_9PSEU